jgi:hypothetical protein
MAATTCDGFEIIHNAANHVDPRPRVVGYYFGLMVLPVKSSIRILPIFPRADKSESLAAESRIALDRTSFVLTGKNVPALGKNVPGFGKNLPALGKDVPAFGKDVPAFGKNLPALGKDVPAFGKNVPGFGKNVPALGKNLPAFGKNVPGFGKNVNGETINGTAPTHFIKFRAVPFMCFRPLFAPPCIVVPSATRLSSSKSNRSRAERSAARRGRE